MTPGHIAAGIIILMVVVLFIISVALDGGEGPSGYEGEDGADWQDDTQI
jgi:hypothetical protein